ncbi:MAG TPA: glycoside hydrolase family 3 C-terminal domain-containing protein [Bacillota bacterium]|nr:glycoside hydrolase family 3 C-terminal domain-containing protein [Bacillota bacterium]HQD06850.1 glycoside hydrolase family 3 C-terminal domain-containing protein [Bacillota bacterium]
MIKELIRQMTLEEKASLCSGLDMWNTTPVKRLGIGSIVVSDGPHGLRRQLKDADNFGIADSVPATCFPTASAMAASWDPELVAEIGAAIAEECLQEGVSVLLAPGVNIKRSPLCGRNFEYYSEDPYLTGEMAVAFINGVQSKGVGTSLKHYAVNNQEHLRMTIDAIVDKRALREIYLPAFEAAVKRAQPWTVMCAYNKLNGTYCSEHRELLTEILKEEWGHQGLVVTDWGACNDRVAGLIAGQELEMPGGGLDNDRAIVKAVKSGRLDEAVLDAAVERILQLVQKAVENLKPGYRYDAEAHHALARKAAAQCAVLLKNENNILPLDRSTKLAVIGKLAEKPRYQGSGSSLINPTRLENALDEMKRRGLKFAYAPGYSHITDAPDEALIVEACRLAKEAEVVVVFAGLTDTYESEGFDREHLKLPANQDLLIQRLARINPNLVVVLSGGAPMEMPWVNEAKGILNMYLAGQAGGAAAVDLLLGEVNPSGKLAETFPLTNSDGLSAAYFPEGPLTVEYRESIFVGYRYFDTAKKEVLFPFGHGLSYTSFEYLDLKVSEERVEDPDGLKVTVTVKNTGPVPGAEVVQLYIQPPESKIFKAAKELKGFKKVFLEPGEEKSVEMTLNRRSFAYYNVNINDWHVENGEYTILIGASSRDIRLSKKITLELPGNDVEVPDYRDACPAYYQLDRQTDIPREQFAALYGRPLPPKTEAGKKVYHRNSTLGDISHTFIGRIMLKAGTSMATGKVKGEEEDSRIIATKNMMTKMAPQLPLRSIAFSSGGLLTLGMIDGLLMILNGRRLRGLGKILTSLPWKKKR